MESKHEQYESDLELRARWLAWRYNLDEDRILAALRRARVRIEDVVLKDFFRYLEFDPPLEEVLFYCRPEVGLKLFETAELDDISKWLELTRRLVRQYFHDWPGNEELCRWEAESHLLFD